MSINNTKSSDISKPLTGNDIIKPKLNQSEDSSNDPNIGGPARFVVCVGASAGGLDAIEAMFKNLDQLTGAAYVLIQHLSPDFKSLMDEILSRFSKIPVVKAQDEMLLRGNCIYLIPPKTDMRVERGRIKLSEQMEQIGPHLPIDCFLESLAEEYGPYSIAVVLSGSGSDGARGVKAIHAAGGFTIVQELNTAKFESMPRASLSTCCVDAVLSPEQIPQAINDHINASDGFIRPPKIQIARSIVKDINTTTSESLNDSSSVEMNDIFDILKGRYGIDFQKYRATTVDRRLERRMSMLRINDLADYSYRLAQDPSELNQLYQDLLIGVTQFFRDPPAFKILKDVVYPDLIRSIGKKRLLRIWVPGCATGEEAYSIAIGIAEELESSGVNADKANIQVKIFATDVHHESLAVGGRGLYTPRSVETIDPESRRRWFEPTEEGNFRIVNSIRRMVIFAPHNLISDPPFTNVDFVSCRNLLIYLEPTLQFKVISSFLFALNHNGYLLLGPSESAGNWQEDLEPVSTRWNVYQKKSSVTTTRLMREKLVNIETLRRSVPTKSLVPLERPVEKPIEQPSAQKAKNNNHLSDLVTAGYEALLSEYVSSGLLIDEKRSILHVFGNATDLIHIQPGRPTSNVMGLIKEDLKAALGAALHRALREAVPIVYRNIRIGSESSDELDDKKTKSVSLIVKPLVHPKLRGVFFFVYLEEKINLTEFHEINSDLPPQYSGSTQNLVELESELQFAREHLQAINEELESSNEELQATNEELVSANEELQSTNEELQSTNEELQSTNEELHSVNEELHSVNTEYQIKITEMQVMSSDMNNLLQTTAIAAIYLDSNLVIRKFTPGVSKLINLLDRDIGRPVSHISTTMGLNPKRIEEIAKLVIERQEPISEELSLEDGDIFIMKTVPYHTSQELKEGVLITFSDVTALRHYESENIKLAERSKQSTSDLQSFSHIASFELLSPVRHIQQFIESLEKDLTDRLPSYYPQLVEQILRMRRLVEGLLEFSAMFASEQEVSSVDCSELLTTALSNLAPLVRRLDADIQYGLLPTVRGSKTELKRVFEAIIDNAVRYSSGRPSLKIDVVHQGEFWLFNFSDNGIGIPQDCREVVFDLFKKSPHLTKFENIERFQGVGLGLAVSKRIIERHGGSIWIDDNKASESGITVSFTIPI